MTGRAILLAAGLVVLSAPHVSGAERWHTVVFGESISQIAERYYGDAGRSDLLIRFNRLETATIRPGDRLRIPYSVEHRVRPGETGSELALRYLGRASDWSVLARLNDLPAEAPLRVGHALVVPVVLEHRIRRGESLAALAERFYGDPSQNDLLGAFNGIDDPRKLSVGQDVRIPVVSLRLAPTPDRPTDRTAPAPTAIEPAPIARVDAVEEPPVTPDWFEQGCREAERAFADGEFDDARERVDALTERADELSLPGDRARLWRLAAAVHVAFDRDDEACEAFRELRAAAAGPIELDPERTSPKIRDALRSCLDAEG